MEPQIIDRSVASSLLLLLSIPNCAPPSRRLRSFFSDCLACRCVYNWPPRFALFHVYLCIYIQIVMPKAAIESWEVGGRAPTDCHGRLTVWLTRVHHSQQRCLYLNFFVFYRKIKLFVRYIRNIKFANIGGVLWCLITRPSMLFCARHSEHAVVFLNSNFFSTVFWRFEHVFLK